MTAKEKQKHSGKFAGGRAKGILLKPLLAQAGLIRGLRLNDDDFYVPPLLLPSDLLQRAALEASHVSTL